MVAENKHGIRILLTLDVDWGKWTVYIATTYAADAPVIAALQETVAASELPIHDVKIFTGSNIQVEVDKFSYEDTRLGMQFVYPFDYTQDTAVEQLQDMLSKLLKDLKMNAPALAVPRNKSQSRLFLNLASKRRGGSPDAYLHLTDAEYFARMAQALGSIAAGPFHVGYQLYCLSESLRIADATNPELYAEYGEALRADPVLRNIFYK